MLITCYLAGTFDLSELKVESFHLVVNIHIANS